MISYLCLLQDTTDYVAYVAKDPVNRRGELISQWIKSIYTVTCIQELQILETAMINPGILTFACLFIESSVIIWPKSCVKKHVGISECAKIFNPSFPHSVFVFIACHILECSDGLAQDVISTIGQAFDLRFQLYLQCPSSKLSSLHDRCSYTVSSTEKAIVLTTCFDIPRFQLGTSYSKNSKSLKTSPRTYYRLSLCELMSFHSLAQWSSLTGC